MQNTYERYTNIQKCKSIKYKNAHMNTKMKKNIFAKKATTHSTAKRLPLNASIPGKLYPPKNNMAIKADEINIATYSENKNNPNFMELYSV